MMIHASIILNRLSRKNETWKKSNVVFEGNEPGRNNWPAEGAGDGGVLTGGELYNPGRGTGRAGAAGAPRAHCKNYAINRAGPLPSAAPRGPAGRRQITARAGGGRGRRAAVATSQRRAGKV
ncbi:hypothetical protein EVAR_65324_1 [Eumeta japonica]|uniref:Uncharacterized protein n=1 Tax=Eumeta variegata TaxID=151549 RepID=A0A4C1YVH2_EUMVA|nr:hypothetical protein EVAR_65324_1 [Eumeta japonica]